MNLIETIQELIKNKPTNDNDLISDLFLNIYFSSNAEERNIINKICVCLTVIQFNKILDKAGIQKPLNKVS